MHLLCTIPKLWAWPLDMDYFCEGNLDETLVDYKINLLWSFLSFGVIGQVHVLRVFNNP